MGMGKYIAETLVAEGTIIAVTDINNKLAEQTAKGTNDNGGKAELWKLDVMGHVEIKNVFKSKIIRRN